MHAYVQLEDNKAEGAQGHRSRVWAVFCGLLSVGLVVALCAIGPGNLSVQSTSQSQMVGTVDNLALVPSNSHLLQRSPGIMQSAMQKPAFRLGFLPGRQYAQSGGLFQSRQVNWGSTPPYGNQQGRLYQMQQVKAEEEAAPEAEAGGEAEDPELAAAKAKAEEAAAEAKAKADEATAAAAAADKTAQAYAAQLAINQKEIEAMQKAKEEQAAKEFEEDMEREVAHVAQAAASYEEVTKTKIANMERKLESGKLSGGRHKSKRHAVKRRLAREKKLLGIYQAKMAGAAR